MKCPKCGRKSSNEQALCPRCDFILDTKWIENNFDVETTRIAKVADTMAISSMSQSVFGEDALILGKDREDFDSFHVSDTGLIQQEVTRARIYVGKSIRSLLAADAVPALLESKSQDRVLLSPFESHVLEWVNGHRPVAAIQRKCGLGTDDFHAALALLADKGCIRKTGIVDPERMDRARKRQLARLKEEAVAQDPPLSEKTMVSPPPGFVSKSEITKWEPRVLTEAGSDGSWTEHEQVPPPEDEGEDFFSPETPDLESPKEEQPFPIEPIRPRRKPRLPLSFTTPGPHPPDAQIADQADPAKSIERKDAGPTDDDSIHEEKTLIKRSALLSKSRLTSDEKLSSLKDQIPLKPGKEFAEAISADGSLGKDAPPSQTEGRETTSLQKSSSDSKPPDPLSPKSEEMDSALPAIPQTSTGESVQGDAQDPVSVAPEDFDVETYARNRKAEKIFEQAQADFAAKRFSSAAMNAKLASIYNPQEEDYKRAFLEWSQVVQPKEDSIENRQDVRLFRNSKRAESKGDYEQAERLLEKAIAINPQAAALYNRLGVLQATRLNNVISGADNLIRACELDPGNLAYKNNLGKVFGMQQDARGRKKKAWRSLAGEEENVVKVKRIRPKAF